MTILVISEVISATTVQLVINLKNQHHRILLLTSERNSSEDPLLTKKYEETLHGVEVIRYFRKWNAVEFLKILPHLLHVHPQIVHFLFEKNHANLVHGLFGILAKSLPHCLLSVSVFDVNKDLSRLKVLRHLLQYSDIVTCPNLESLGELRGLSIKSRNQKRLLLPPVLEVLSNQEGERSGATSEGNGFPLYEQFQNYLVIPFYEKNFDPTGDFFKRVLKLSHFKPVILWGSYEHWSLRERKQMAQWFFKNNLEKSWAVTGELSVQEHQNLLKKADALVLAGLSLYPREFIEYVNESIRAQVPLVIDSIQSHVHAQVWKNGFNCWLWDKKKILQNIHDWSQKGQPKLQSSLTDFLKDQEHLLDSPFNELNRAYIKAFAHR